MFRWAIFGTGPMAQKFVLALRQADNAVATVVVSRDLARAQAFAKELGIAHAIAGYDAIADRNDVDAVYIATPPSEHAAHAMACLNSGKPTLIEKPFAANAREARQIADAAIRNGVFCMEGMWTRFLPAVQEAKRRLDSGAIGELRSLHGSFGGSDVVDPTNSAFNPQLGGGALAHRGVYPISLALYFAGRPSSVASVASIGETGVDEDVSISLGFGGSAVGSFSASLRSEARNEFVISGTEGSIRLPSPIYRPSSLVTRRGKPKANSNKATSGLREGELAQLVNQVSFPVRGLLTDKWEPFRYRGSGYVYEIAEVMNSVALGRTQSEIMPLSSSIYSMEVLDAVRSAWAVGANI